jgi:hypothetical protein
MIFGIVVEGPADAAAYSTLIPRIRPAVESVLSRPCGGKSPLKENFVGFLKEFQSRPVEKALVIRDSDCRDPRAVEEKLQQRLHESGFHPPFPLHFYATSCMLDTWLLADEGAVNQVARQRGKTPSAQPVADPLEGRRNAKALFRRMLSQARLLADPAVYAEVAAAVDIDRVKRRCPYFQQFIDRVDAC